MVTQLDEVVARLERRLRWGMEQIKRLNAVRERQGALDPEDDALFRRCDSLIKKLERHDASWLAASQKATRTSTPSGFWP